MEAIGLSLKGVRGADALLVEDIGMSSKGRLGLEALLEPMGISSKDAGFSGRSSEFSSWDNPAGEEPVGTQNFKFNFLGQRACLK